MLQNCLRASLLTVFCNLSSSMIGESATRKGERAKKVPKYMQYDDADYAAFPPAKTPEQKERQASSAELNQIAKVLQKFLSSLNQKFRDYQPIRPQPSIKTNGLFSPPADSSPPKPIGTAQGALKRPREGVDTKTGKSDGRKPAGGATGKTTVSSSLQMDQDYHGMLSDHIRTAYPNISNLSPEMLRGLEIPRQLLQGLNGKSKTKDLGKSKEGKEVKGTRRGQELKPFKRQSYHVAIAYHIHLKRIRSVNPNATDIDPTYPARKMRESQQQQH